MNLVQSLTWIICSTLLITGGTYKALQTYHRYENAKRTSSKYYLSRIVQTGPQREALKTNYLAELMRVSADRPVTFANFDLQLAQKRLLASPVIKTAEVHMIKPDTVFVDYTVRQPIAWLYDFENIALDEEGTPFPVTPYFTPKKLPEVYLGIKNFYWNRPIGDSKAKLALTLLELLSRLSLNVRRLDVSKAFEPSLGRREVVLILDEQGFTKIIRLTPRDFAQELGNYLELRSKLPPKPEIIDLRIPNLGFIQERS